MDSTNSRWQANEAIRADLSRRWRAIEDELNRLNAMPQPGRESFASRIAELKAEQDHVEVALRDNPAFPNSDHDMFILI